MNGIIKKRIACFFFSCIINVALAQNAGKVIEQITMRSATLNKNVKYAVYLPSDYTSSERTYPVVYLLHGYSDDHTG